MLELNLHKFYGDRLYRFELGQNHGPYYLCPVQVENTEGYQIAVFSPDGEADSNEEFYSTVEEAIAAGRRYADRLQAQWLISSLSPNWLELGVINTDVSERLSQWSECDMWAA